MILLQKQLVQQLTHSLYKHTGSSKVILSRKQNLRNGPPQTIQLKSAPMTFYLILFLPIPGIDLSPQLFGTKEGQPTLLKALPSNLTCKQKKRLVPHPSQPLWLTESTGQTIRDRKINIQRAETFNYQKTWWLSGLLLPFSFLWCIVLAVRMH